MNLDNSHVVSLISVSSSSILSTLKYLLIEDQQQKFNNKNSIDIDIKQKHLLNKYRICCTIL